MIENQKNKNLSVHSELLSKRDTDTKNERWDDLLRCGYQILQDPNTFCFGMDAVLLSGYVRAEAHEKVLDLGSGNGILPILLAAKTQSHAFTGLEVQTKLFDMALKSVAHNHLEEKIHMVQGDIRQIEEYFLPQSFDVVVTNPPYMVKSHGRENENEAVSIARHEVLCSLDELIASIIYAIKPQGRCYMVHRPFRLAEIMTKMRNAGLEPKRMRLVYPFVDKEPNMVLLEARRGGKSNMVVEKPLIVYKSVGEYTDEVLEIYGF